MSVIYLREPEGVCPSEFSIEEREEANAKLYAAAPTMLEALEMVAEWNGDPGKYLNLDEVRAAIRAAKGE